MWILPKNYLLSSHFAQDMVASKEDLTLPGLIIESSLLAKSKPSLLRTWLTRWKPDSYLQHLFTRILKPSQHTCFETKLALSLAVIRVSPLVQQDSEKEQMIQDTCGLTSGDTLNQLDLFSASLKTSRDISVLDSEKSLATWKASVTKQRGEYSQRVKSAHLTRESESTSWQTPAARDYKGAVLPETLAAKNRNPMTNSLPDAIQHKTGSGSLNPEWVEWLMGVPTGWTELECWEME
jgi:hypothetical protein